MPQRERPFHFQPVDEPGLQTFRETNGTPPIGPVSNQEEAGKAVWPIEPTTPEVSDEELIRRCQGGDGQAFEALARRHMDSVYSLALRFLGDPSDAEDVAQDTFLRAYRAIGEFRGRSKLSTWLYRICRNLCLNWKNRRKPLSESAEWVDQIADSKPDGLERIAEAERGAILQEALLELRSELREVVVLYYTNDLSYAEISEVLDVPVGTVRSRLHRGRERLRELLGGRID